MDNLFRPSLFMQLVDLDNRELCRLRSSDLEIKSSSTIRCIVLSRFPNFVLIIRNVVFLENHYIKYIGIHSEI